MARHEVVVLLEHGVQLLPGLEYLQWGIEAGVNARPCEVISQYRLKSRVARDSEVRAADLENLPMVHDVVGCFLSGTPLGHRVRGDGRIAVFSYHRYGSHLAPGRPKARKDIPLSCQPQRAKNTPRVSETQPPKQFACPAGYGSKTSGGAS